MIQPLFHGGNKRLPNGYIVNVDFRPEVYRIKILQENISLQGHLSVNDDISQSPGDFRNRKIAIEIVELRVVKKASLHLFFKNISISIIIVVSAWVGSNMPLVEFHYDTSAAAHSNPPIRK